MSFTNQREYGTGFESLEMNMVIPTVATMQQDTTGLSPSKGYSKKKKKKSLPAKILGHELYLNE